VGGQAENVVISIFFLTSVFVYCILPPKDKIKGPCGGGIRGKGKRRSLSQDQYHYRGIDARAEAQ
jgi:hypothetical protein